MLKSTSDMKMRHSYCFPKLGNPQHVPFLPERFRKKKQFSELLEDNDSFADEVTEALSKAAPYISANFR